ncbi:TPA: hypothetical protein ACV5ZF_004195 [Salmonella enterica]|uniref:Uncharacterized protein n=2 Tax=Salmonella enterica TaxID=28901 RepID=A0A3V8I8N7_SALER|nr:hypothetical protein [Salmonella enterica]ECC3554058.1 hypothetical protein [Salmonella enterica subsp. salamae]HCM1852863.1 hypothetical protein [Salmonella enterica subsp. salamae serovar 42:z29:-]AZT25086.1 hypothetical protein ELZ76_14655 [Salmonella enterica subsp. salamae serovar 42:r:-]AZT51318.1 hypothetical protein EL003_14625 [Salmonella enterica subsp. salamae serovar 42:r:-]AZT55743.1 hypothetical protein EL009_14670 [Salmonella enterica subsp. salamae serovar 42:r:-]
MKKDTCMFCGEPATLLCDGLIGWDADEDENGRITNCRGMFTCDAPICRHYATWHGNLFFEGKNRHMDTKDLCPICQSLHNAGQRIRVAEHRKDKAIPEPCLTREQAARIRAAHWAGFTSEYTRSVKVIQGGGQQSFDF